MQTSENIRAMARKLVVTYTHHVKNEVAQGNRAYIDCGLDGDIDLYNDLFRVVMSKLLGVRYTAVNKYPRLVVNRLAKVVKSSIVEPHEKEMFANGIYGVILYDLVQTVLDVVRTESMAVCS